MTSSRIVVTRRPPGQAVEILQAAGQVWIWSENRPIDRQTLRSESRTATGLYTMLTDPIDEPLLSGATDLRVVSQMAVGVDNIDLEACRKLGITVGHTPDVLTDTTADLAFGLLIAVARRFREGHLDVGAGRWGDWDPGYLVGHDVSGSTLGIIGFGRIGQAIARRSVGFDMTVLYNQRHQSTDDTTSVYVGLDELLERSDHVVLAAPLNADTHHLIGAEQLNRMRTTATLVNVGRGPLVDPDALYEALAAGTIFAAGLDVTEPEPIPPDHPLVGLPNCFILPHLGSSSARTRAAMAELAARNLVAGLRGEPMEAPVFA